MLEMYHSCNMKCDCFLCYKHLILLVWFSLLKKLDVIRRITELIPWVFCTGMCWQTNWKNLGVHRSKAAKQRSPMCALSNVGHWWYPSRTVQHQGIHQGRFERGFCTSELDHVSSLSTAFRTLWSRYRWKLLPVESCFLQLDYVSSLLTTFQTLVNTGGNVSTLESCFLQLNYVSSQLTTCRILWGRYRWKRLPVESCFLQLDYVSSQLTTFRILWSRYRWKRRPVESCFLQLDYLSSC